MNTINETTKTAILADLQPLFKEAEEKGLWFYGAYHDIWFTPDELRKKHAEGKFLWGAVNWKLRHPSERKTEIDRQIENLNKEKQRFS